MDTACALPTVRGGRRERTSSAGSVIVSVRARCTKWSLTARWEVIAMDRTETSVRQRRSSALSSASTCIPATPSRSAPSTSGSQTVSGPPALSSTRSPSVR